MTIQLLAFGIAADITGSRSLELQVEDNLTSAGLRAYLNERFPPLGQLSAYAIAINREYSDPGDVIHTGDEIAILPPVSGG